MNYFLPYGLIWHPDGAAIWSVPLSLIFIFFLARGAILKLYGNKLILAVYILGIAYNLIGIFSELTYLDLHIPNNVFNFIWYINVLIIIYEQFIQRKKIKVG